MAVGGLIRTPSSIVPRGAGSLQAAIRRDDEAGPTCGSAVADVEPSVLIGARVHKSPPPPVLFRLPLHSRRGGLAVVAGRSRQILAVAEVGWADNEAGDPLLNRATFHVSARVGLVRRSSDDPNRGATAGRYEYARPLAYRRATGTSPICWRARLLGKCRRREQKG